MKSNFIRGMRNGIPIMLGYFSVSFGFGILAVKMGLSVLQAVGISATNLTSAGQVAGLSIIAAGGSIIEMALCQFVINLRYALMGFSLSQHLDNSFTTLHRIILSFGITDEIFAVAISRSEPISASYMYGLIFTPFIGWTSGTLLGAVAGDLMPQSVCNAMGLMLYGMFIAIIIPPAKRNFRVLINVIFSASLSVLFYYVFPFVSFGFVVIICAVISSLLCAWLFPIKEEEEK